MKKLNSVSSLTLTGYIVVLVITISSAAVIGIKNTNVEKNTNIFINETLPELSKLESILKLTSELEIGAYSLYGLTIEKATFAKLTTDAKKTTPLSKENPLFHQLKLYFDSLAKLQVIMSDSSVDWDKARTTLSQISIHTAKIRTELDQQKTAITKLAKTGSSNIIKSISDVKKINWLMVILTCLALFSAYFLAQKQIASPIRQLSNQLRTISDNLSLSSKLPTHKTDEINQATQSVNHLLYQFKKAICNVSDTAAHVQQSSSTLKTVTNTSEQAITLLADHIEQLITKMLGLEQQILSSVFHSTSAANAATQGAKDIESGMNEVKKTSDSIANLVSDIEKTGEMLTKLKTSGSQVSTVVKSVAEIAEQTNLLALNAAIEAARAGESGRGFAVVADEVRSLAQKTHRSTEEIDTMIGTITSVISDVVTTISTNQVKAQDSMFQATTTVEVLSSIKESILALSHVSTDVASSAESVQKNMESLRQQVSDFKQVGETVATSSNETRSEAIQLATNAQQLSVVINKFNL